QEFSPGSNGRMTTMGVYIRDLLLGQYYFDTLFPRIPVPVMRTIVANLGNMKLPTKHCGVTGETTRGSEETARRPPSVKASLSVSFGQRAPHRASTRDSSPVRRNVTPSYDDDSKRSSPSRPRSRSRERDRGGRDRDRDHRNRDSRDWDSRRSTSDYDRKSRNSYRRDYDRDDRRDGGGSGSRRRSRSRSRSRDGGGGGGTEKISGNMAKLKDLYGDLSHSKEDEDKGYSGPSGTEEVIRLGGSTWR
ncbi:hypothetical protein M569_17330, partial [Genlisea aurea]